MSKFNNGGKPTKRVAVAIFRVAGRMANENRSPIPGASIDDIFRRLDPSVTVIPPYICIIALPTLTTTRMAYLYHRTPFSQ